VTRRAQLLFIFAGFIYGFYFVTRPELHARPRPPREERAEGRGHSVSPQKWQLSWRPAPRRGAVTDATRSDTRVPLTYIRNFIRSRVESAMRALVPFPVCFPGQSGGMIKHFVRSEARARRPVRFILRGNGQWTRRAEHSIRRGSGRANYTPRRRRRRRRGLTIAPRDNVTRARVAESGGFE